MRLRRFTRIAHSRSTRLLRPRNHMRDEGRSADDLPVIGGDVHTTTYPPIRLAAR